MRFTLACLVLMIGLAAPAGAGAATPPNIVFIFADDMGYGDVSAFNPQAKFSTPHLDALAAGGLVLTDAHTSSGVCTPSRYSLLTGRYCWRTWLKRGVLGGYSGALIDPTRPTLASVLKGAGYHTACFGKWHVGMDLPTTDGKKARQWGGPPEGKAKTYDPEKHRITTNVDWSGRIENGPLRNGFDTFFGINGSLDMPPYVYIDGDRFVGEPTEVKAFHRPGPAHADFEAVDVLPDLTHRLITFIAEQPADRPFFAYFPITGPHNPVVPTPEFVGRSGIGRYGDFCMQIDHHVGQVVQALKDSGAYGNTLLVFSSDNGVESFGYHQLRTTGHASSAHLRGVKRDLWEGGHRVPTLLHWPAAIQTGRISNETVCMTDFLPTFADLAGASLPEGVAGDGVSLTPLIAGEHRDAPLRQATVHHGLKGEFAIRQGDWVYIDARDGSDRDNEPQWFKTQRGYEPHDHPGELFNLADDPAQRHNLYAQHPERVLAMKALLETIEAAEW